MPDTAQNLSNSELAILSLIAEGPQHGYEIEKLIEARNMRAWTEIGFSSIYRILNKLEEQGFISGTIGMKEGKGPARKVYQVTPQGEAAWRDASLQTLATPSRSYSSFLLGLNNIAGLPKVEATNAITTYKENLELVRAVLAETAATHPQRDFYLDAFFDYLVTLQDAEIKWLTGFLQQLSNQPDTHKQDI